ncbi:cytochrome c556 [Limimaricola variabilis]|jgi:cytochrome c556|uniref:Cytochrome c556 n=1 Tax=Limimaricola variabilis TaxID=1492771 RepID=A0ABR6HJF6_9RHOB|nr:cytochrome c [Limimaricola variabilis]MBB3710691.1 cytochrome c556 [Limimaricola variabilis]WPY95224.1 cytochrome c [Limimaricola variabilis]
MIHLRRPAIAAAALALLAAPLSAEVFEPKKAQELRESHMKLMGAHLGVLGTMAKGEMEYDANVASAAAEALAGLAQGTNGNYWVEGSSTEDLEDSRALPELWQDMEDVGQKAAALRDATQAMQEAAGTDLAALQGAMKSVGDACGDCHKAYRKPEE